MEIAKIHKLKDVAIFPLFDGSVEARIGKIQAKLGL